MVKAAAESRLPRRVANHRRTGWAIWCDGYREFQGKVEPTRQAAIFNDGGLRNFMNRDCCRVVRVEQITRELKAGRT